MANVPKDVMPPTQGSTKSVHGWALEAIEEGEAFLRGQPGYDKIDETIDAIMGEDLEVRPSSFSKVTLNKFGKIALDLKSGLTDTKPFWEYRTSNKRFDQQAQMAGKLSTAWYLNRNIDLKFGDVVSYCLAAASGYAHLVFNSQTQDLDLIPEDPRDVLPVRPGSLISIQESFGVVIRRERPVNYVRKLYPQHAQYIKADRDGSYRAEQRSSRAQKMLSGLGLRSGFVENLYKSLGSRPQAASLNVPSVDLFTIYVDDQSRNETGRPIYLGNFSPEGSPLDNWSYVVQPGESLYPRKRCIVLCRSCPEPLYDGPSIYWHGLFPTPKLTLDPWPWTWLGKSPLKDLLPLHQELKEHLRIVADRNRKFGRPDLVADKNAISQAALNKIDTRRDGLKLRYNPTAGKGIELVDPKPLDPTIMATIEFLLSQMDEISGARDLRQLMQMGQIPSVETVEKMLESMSPAVRLRSRVMEAFLREMAHIVMSNFFQFYTLAQRIAVLGPGGMTFEDFDFDPGTLIPDFVMEEDYDEMGVRPSALVRGPLPRSERARTFMRQFTYHVAPGSLLAASQITKKLLYLNLARAGWCDLWTLGEVLEIPNMGEPPAGTIPERLAMMNQMGLGMAVSSTGRKASGQQMPSMRGDGRVSESG